MPDSFALAHARRVVARLEREHDALDRELERSPLARTQRNLERLADLDRRWRVWAAFVEQHEAARECAA